MRVFPRLPLSAALTLADELRERYEEGGIGAVTEMSASWHPQAAPVPTGGHVASSDEIAMCRDDVLSSIEQWIGLDEIPSGQRYMFDSALGLSLHRNLRIMPADAAHNETWHFLSLVVFPDVAALRFPALHTHRITGHPRNVLWRAWLREEIFGDLLREYEEPLGEDELVGIFERSSFVRNHRLARAVATTVMRRPREGGRSEWARGFYVRARYFTGARLLDALSDDELADVVEAAAIGGDHAGR